MSELTPDALTLLYHTLLAPSEADTLAKVRQVTVLLIALVLSVAVHEFGHAFVADRLGDRTPRIQGRVTLNPLVHADPIGTFLLPLIGAWFGGMLFGWGRPVMVQPLAFTRKLRMKVAHLLVALAGPMMNVILALLVTTTYAVLLATGLLKPAHPVAGGIIMVIQLNWVLFFFNLIPIPPLDGGTVLAGILPDRYEGVNQFLRQYGFLILIGLMFTPILGFFLRPAIWITAGSLSVVYRLVG